MLRGRYIELLKEIKQDFPNMSGYQIFIKYIMSKGLQAVVLFRISSYLYQHNHRQIAKLVKNYSLKRTGADIAESAKIGAGLSIGHPVGIVVGGVELGTNCFLLAGVVLGSISREKGGGKIIGGNNIYFGSGCKVIGNIKIGSNVQIGANAVVIKDIPDNSTCVGVPGRNIVNESIIH